MEPITSLPLLVVCCAAQEASVRHTMSIQEETKFDFHTYVALRSLTQIQPNCCRGTCQVGDSANHSSRFRFFLHTLKNCYKTRMHARIELKLGAQNGCIKMNLCTNFHGNSVKISGVMTNCSCKTRSICCHADRVNHLDE